jgi:CHRD domain-containing protein
MTRIMSLALAGAASIAVMAAPVHAEMLTLKAQLTGAQEVPPTGSAGTGTADVKVDTEAKKATWTVQYSGLSGDATAAHFHGPAMPGESAGPVIDISGKIENGAADLTDSQLADLEAGKLYINIHTEKFPDGEIRGQVTK